MTVNEKIAKIRERMAENHIDAVIVPSADPHMSEYYSEHWKTRAWLSGFTGSAGSFVITQSVAGLWTDGRYYVQAEKQLSGSEGGAGKTTLLQIMGTLDKADAGTVILNGTEVNRLKEKELSAFRNQQIGFVFQFHQLLPEFTALENVMIPAFISGASSGDAMKRAKETLDFLGLAERASHIGSFEMPP